MSRQNKLVKNTLSGYQIGICSAVSVLFMTFAPIFYNTFQYAHLGIIDGFSWGIFILTTVFYGIPIFVFGLMGFIGYKIFSKVNQNYDKKILLVIFPLLIITSYVLSSLVFHIYPFDQTTSLGIFDRLPELFFNNMLLAFSLGGLIHYFNKKIFFSNIETAFLLNIFIATGIFLGFQTMSSLNAIVPNNTAPQFIGINVAMAIPLGLFGYYLSRKLISKMKKYSLDKQTVLDEYETNYLDKLDED